MQATLQCLGCLKAKVPVAKSYHCSTKCFSDAWQHHRVLHDRGTSAVNDSVNEDEELFGRYNSAGPGVINANLSGGVSSTSLTNGSTPFYPSSTTQRSGGETWFEVGRSKTYTPSADDIGHVLKFECVVVDAESKLASGPVNTLLTSRVIPAPSPSPRCLVPVSGVDVIGQLDSSGRASSSGSFTVLSYNILADVYATSESYSYCPSWALSWPYRRQNLLREIVGYHADIVCLQEVCWDILSVFFKIKWVLFTSSTQKGTPFSCCVGKKNILFLERDHRVNSIMSLPFLWFMVVGVYCMEFVRMTSISRI